MKTMLQRRMALVVALLSLGALGLLGLIPQGREPMAGLSLLRLGLALLAILALIRAAVPLLQGMGSRAGRKQARLRTGSVISLGGRQKVAILLVDDRELLVGFGGEQITLLAELGDPSQDSARERSPGEFRERLERISQA